MLYTQPTSQRPLVLVYVVKVHRHWGDNVHSTWLANMKWTYHASSRIGNKSVDLSSDISPFKYCLCEEKRGRRETRASSAGHSENGSLMDYIEILSTVQQDKHFELAALLKLRANILILLQIAVYIYIKLCIEA